MGVLASRSIEPIDGAQKKSFELSNLRSLQDETSVQQPRSTVGSTNMRLADSVSAVTLVRKDEQTKELRE